MQNFYIYLLVLAIVSYAIRVAPFLLLKERIQNEFVQSFLYYVPYVTLAVMTFPSILAATEYPLAGAAALITGSVMAWRGKGFFAVALTACMTVLAIEVGMGYLGI